MNEYQGVSSSLLALLPIRTQHSSHYRIQQSAILEVELGLPLDTESVHILSVDSSIQNCQKELHAVKLNSLVLDTLIQKQTRMKKPR